MPGTPRKLKRARHAVRALHFLSGRLVASALEETGPNPTRADMLRVNLSRVSRL
jgi:hypothetical protein